MRSIVLLSAGLDSSLNFYEARLQSDVVLSMTFDYGQRAASQEILFAQKLSDKFKIDHCVIRLPWMKTFGASSLTNNQLEIPTHQVRIDDLKTSESTAKSVWVPNRNGILLNIAAGYAESLNAQWIVPGFNAEEAVTFPDNSQAFLTSLNAAFYYSTSNHVEVKCFTTSLDKSAIIARAKELNVDFELIWPCYFAGDIPCGACESCQRFQRAATKNNLKTSWMSS